MYFRIIINYMYALATSVCFLKDDFGYYSYAIQQLETKVEVSLN